MAHGQWTAAWHYHPFGVMLFVYCAWQVVFRVMQVVRIKRGRPPWQLGRWHDYLIHVYFGAFVVFGAVRLIGQWWPFV